MSINFVKFKISVIFGFRNKDSKKSIQYEEFTITKM